MSNTEKYADDLVKFATQARDGQETSELSNLNAVDTALVSDLIALAGTMQPDTSFTTELKSRLLHTQKTEARLPTYSLLDSVTAFISEWRKIVMMRKRWMYTVGLAVIFLLTIVAVMPVLAQFALEHFAPREVESLPLAPESVTVATIPSYAYEDDIEALAQQAGFSPLIPEYLPPNCAFTKGYYLDEPIGEIHLTYNSVDQSLPCFRVAQRQARENRTDRPFVGDGAVEEITVNGKPALYISGIWVIEGDLPGAESGETTVEVNPEELFENAEWADGPQQLVFEHEGLLIRIDAEFYISKDELVKFAESMTHAN